MAITTNHTIRSTVRTGTEFGNRNGVENLTVQLNVPNGTAAGQADLVAFDERTVADGATDAIDLTATLTDVYGDAVSFAEVTEIFITNSARSGTANTTNLTVGGGANGYAGLVQTVLAPGGRTNPANYDSADGLGAVVDGTGDLINVVNAAGAAATYRIVVVGRSS